MLEAPALAVAEVERAIRRLEAYQLKLVARQTTTSRTHAARAVALATELESGHDRRT